MKTFIVIAIVLSAIIASAATNEFVVNSITKYTITKSKSIAVDYTTPVMVTTTATSGTCNMYLGTDSTNTVPLQQYVPLKVQAGSSVTAAVFTCNSSAGNVVSVVK